MFVDQFEPLAHCYLRDAMLARYSYGHVRPSVCEFITVIVQLCLQHDAREPARRAGSSASADTSQLWCDESASCPSVRCYISLL